MTKPLLFLALLLVAFPAAAQYNGPAVEACRALAKREAAREGNNKPEDIVIVQDASLFLERDARKIGNQQVGFVLSGNGSVVLPGTPSAELSFVCVLANEKRALFFNWLPRQNVSPIAQCTRSEGLRGKSRECLAFLKRVAEQDLTHIYAQRFQEALEGGEKTLAAYRRSNDEWKQYLEAECARRRDVAPKGVSPDDYQLACTVEIMRQRRREMRGT